MTRIVLVMLLPLAIAAAYFLDRIREKGSWGTRLIWAVVLPALLFELSATSMPSSAKTEWRERVDEKVKQIPDSIQKDAILFFAAPDSDGWQFKPELDAMWAAMKSGRKSMNGYSGNHPPGKGFDFQHVVDCSVLPLRVLSYIDFAERRLGETPNYQELMEKVVPIGFVGCDPGWWATPPTITTSSRTYSKEEFSKLSFGNAVIMDIEGAKILKFDILNNGKKEISAKSGVGRPIRISWRYLDGSCSPRSGWDSRKDIPFDVPPKGVLPMIVPLDQISLRDSCGIEVSIVQELEFWGHDIGISPLRVKF